MPEPWGRARRAVGVSFFLQGLCFATWGSRIPAVQARLNLNEPELGALLFALPVGLMVSLPLTNWVIARLGARRSLALAMAFYASFLAVVGFSPSVPWLVAALFCFGLGGNSVNISVNTLATEVEAAYGRPIMASFHGLWSLAGFTGAGVGAVMTGLGVAPAWHFLGASLFVLAMFSLQFRALPSGAGAKELPHYAWPDRGLLVLGLIAFCSMIAEGTMFDWSGVYFRRVVGAEGAWVSLGYVAFMSTMAGARFLADGLTHRLGAARLLLVNGVLAASGLALAVALPRLWPAAFGFLLVGAGVSSVVPLVYSAAGRSGRLAPSAAISAVSSIGFVGFLAGPPFIGFVAGLSSLRVSFLLVAGLALGISALSRALPR